MATRLGFTRKPGFMPVAALLFATIGIAGGPRLYSLLTTKPEQFAAKKPVPEELVKMQKALKAQKYIHIFVENSWDLWVEPGRVAFSGKSKDIPGYFSTGKKFVYFDHEKAVLSDIEKEVIGHFPSAYFANSLYYINLLYWSQRDSTVSKGILKANLLEVGMDPMATEIEFDPKTWLPKTQTITKNNQATGYKNVTTVYKFDYDPIDPRVYIPTIPKNLKTTDNIATRAKEEAELRKPIATIPIGQQKLEIRRIRINQLGDVYIDYTGPFPDDPYHSPMKTSDPGQPPVVVPRPRNTVPGSLEISDSLGFKTGSGKEGYYELPGIHLPNRFFANIPSHPLEHSSKLRILRYSVKENDLRPRTFTLRFRINPTSDQSQPKVHTWTSGLLTPFQEPQTFYPLERAIESWYRQAESGNLPSAETLDRLGRQFLQRQKSFINWTGLYQLYKMNQSLGRNNIAHELAKFGKDNTTEKKLPEWVVAELQGAP